MQFTGWCMVTFAIWHRRWAIVNSLRVAKSNERRTFTTMAQQHYRTPFKKALLQFITEPDPFLAMLKWVMTEMMRIEAEAKVGAAKGKHAQDRTTYFSGARARRVDTRLGTVYLLVPKVRKGGYIPFFVSERRRSEQALIAVVQEAFINGVSTRKIERLAHAMGIENISASQVSEFNKELDSQVADFKTRPLAEEYPFLWIDALYQKVRVEGRVVSVAVMIACGVNPAGSREILAVEPMFDESEDSLAGLLPEAQSQRHEEDRALHLRRPRRDPGRGPEGVAGRLLAALQGPLHAEHPGQGPAQGEGPLRGPSEADLARAGQEERPAGGRRSHRRLREAVPRGHPLPGRRASRTRSRSTTSRRSTRSGSPRPTARNG